MKVVLEGMGICKKKKCTPISNHTSAHYGNTKETTHPYSKYPTWLPLLNRAG